MELNPVSAALEELLQLTNGFHDVGAEMIDDVGAVASISFPVASSFDESEATEPLTEDVKLARPRRLHNSSSPEVGDEWPESLSLCSLRFSELSGDEKRLKGDVYNLPIFFEGESKGNK